MRTKVLHWLPSPAMAVGLTALFIALGGTGYAATSLVHSGAATHPLTWKYLKMNNGWTVYTAGTSQGADPIAVTKDAEGFVHLRGTLDGTARTSTFVTRLPLGYRPLHKIQSVTVSTTNGDNVPQLASAEIMTTGQIVVWPGTGATLGFVSLDGVEFYAG